MATVRAYYNRVWRELETGVSISRESVVPA
jgi:hypothetical protein